MQNIQEITDRYVALHEMLRHGFPWEYALTRQFGALLLVGSPNAPTVEGIKDMREHIRKETSVFSGFRGLNELMMAILLHRDADGGRLFERTRHVYSLLKEAGLHGSLYMPMAGLFLAKNADDASMPALVVRMGEFYKGMKERHFWLTGEDDFIYAALLATSNLSVHDSLEEMESLYHDLSGSGFSKGNGLQSLTHVLVLGEESCGIKRDRTIRLYQYLIERRYRLSDYQLAFLGVMVLQSERPEELADQAIELENRLKGIRGFGNFSVDRKTRFMLAASLLAEVQDGRLPRRNRERRADQQRPDPPAGAADRHDCGGGGRLQRCCLYERRSVTQQSKT